MMSLLVYYSRANSKRVLNRKHHAAAATWQQSNLPFPFFSFCSPSSPHVAWSCCENNRSCSSFFLNTIEASKILSRKQLSAAVYTCSCYLWSDLSEICKRLLQIVAKPDYVEWWFMLQIKAWYPSSHLSHCWVSKVSYIKHNWRNCSNFARE